MLFPTFWVNMSLQIIPNDILTSNAVRSGSDTFNPGKMSARILSNKETSSAMNFGTLAFLIELMRILASSSSL